MTVVVPLYAFFIIISVLDLSSQVLYVLWKAGYFVAVAFANILCPELKQKLSVKARLNPSGGKDALTMFSPCRKKEGRR